MDKIYLALYSISLSRYFIIHNNSTDDTYLKYTLSHNSSRKISHLEKNSAKWALHEHIQTVAACLLHDTRVYIEHMLLQCPLLVKLWQEVEEWIKSLGNENYILSDRRRILG